MQKLIEYFKGYGVDANTTATIFITLFVFSLGLVFTWLSRQIKSSNEKSFYRESFITILKDFDKACEKQYNAVNLSLNKVGLKEGNDFIISIVPIATLDYLNKIDFNIFLKHFQPAFYTKYVKNYSKRYSNAISKLFVLIAQIKVQNDTVSESMKIFMESYRISEQQYFDNIASIRKYHDQLGLHLQEKPKENNLTTEFIQKFFNLFGYFSVEEPKLDIASTHKNIIIEILKLNHEYQLPISQEIAEFALKCDIAFQNVYKIESLLTDRFKDFAHFHRRASKLTKVIIKIVK